MSKPPQNPAGAKVAGIILPPVVYGLICYTWYIYVFRVCAYLLIEKSPSNKTQAIVFIVISSVLWIMALVCYTRVLFTPPGKPVKANTPLLESSQGAVLSRNLPRHYYSPQLYNFQTMTTRYLDAQDNINVMPIISISNQDGQPKYCHICECYKPERAHHCRDCNACVIKMDHHCPWVSGCVGFGNYKFFFLFVTYTGLYALWNFVTALPLVIKGVKDENADLDAQWIVLIVIAFVFGFTVLGFSGVHAAYIIRNETTIEHLGDRDNDIRVDFDMSGQNFEVVSMPVFEYLWERSKMENWKQVMGNNPLGWFFPIKRGVGDGYVFPYNDIMFQHIVEKARKQRSLLDIHHDHTVDLPTTEYAAERLSSVESTTHMTK